MHQQWLVKLKCWGTMVTYCITKLFGDKFLMSRPTAQGRAEWREGATAAGWPPPALGRTTDR